MKGPSQRCPWPPPQPFFVWLTLVSSQRLCMPESFPRQLYLDTHTPSTRWAPETPSCRPVSLSDDTFLYFTRVTTLRILCRSVLFPARLRLSWVIKDGRPNVILFSLCGFSGAEQIFPPHTCRDLRLSHSQSSVFLPIGNAFIGTC